MRQRKAKGKNPAVITLTEEDICRICREHVESLGCELGKRMIIQVPYAALPGVKRRKKLEIAIDVKSLPDAPKENTRIIPRTIYSNWKPTDGL